MDNFEGAGTEGFFKNIFNTLTKIFKISKREVGKFRFTGVDVEDSKEDRITILQNAYQDTIKPLKIAKTEDRERKLTNKEFKEY